MRFVEGQSKGSQDPSFAQLIKAAYTDPQLPHSGQASIAPHVTSSESSQVGMLSGLYPLMQELHAEKLDPDDSTHAVIASFSDWHGSAVGAGVGDLDDGDVGNGLEGMDGVGGDDHEQVRKQSDP